MAWFNCRKKGSGGSTSILIGTNNPTSAIGQNGQLYLKHGGNPAYHYDEDLGGYCDKDYYVHDADTYLATQSALFRKTYDGGAISVYWHSDPWYGPILISTVQDNVKYSYNLSVGGSAVIDGVTWYISTDGSWSSAYDSNHAFPVLETNYVPEGANIENAIRAVLTASGYTSGQLSGTYVLDSYLKKNNAWQDLIGSDVRDIANIEPSIQAKTGSFTTGLTTDSVVEINCGFEPDFIKVLMDFGASQTTAYYFKTGNEDNAEISVWDLRPTEGAIYQIFDPSGAVTNETGICEVTSNGFKYKAHGGNTTSKACTYVAYKFDESPTEPFSYYSCCGFGEGGGIILPYTLNSDYKITVEFYETQYDNDACVIGNTFGANRSHLTEYSNKWFTSSGSGETNFGSWVGQTVHTYVNNNGNNKNEFDGVEVTDYTPASDVNIWYTIGCRTGTVTSNKFRGYIKSYKIESISTGDVICYLRPAKFVYPGVISKEGLFDSVNEAWYENGTMTVSNDY